MPAAMQAQIINKSNEKQIGQSIKNGIDNALETIQQDTHPTGDHELWEGYIAPRLGLEVSSLPGAGGRPELGVVAGVYVETFVMRNLGISIELNYDHKGGNHINNGGYQSNYNLDYLNSLYLAHWYPWSYRPLSFYTGLYMSRVISAKRHDKGNGTANIKDDLHKGEIDIPIGVSYEWKQWEFDARYVLSPRHLAGSKRGKEYLGNARNMMFSLSVAYRIKIF